MNQGLVELSKLRLIFSILTYSPKRSSFILLASSIAGVLEGISIVALLPILNIIIGSNNSQEGTGLIFNFFYGFFSYLQLELTLVNALIFFFLFILLKSIFSLLAMNYIGIVIAQISFEMRTSFIQSTVKTLWPNLQNRKSGESLNTINFEIPKAASIYRYACTLLSSTFQILVLLYLILGISVATAAAGILLGLLIFSLLGFFIKISGEQARRQKNIMDSLISNMSEVLKGIKVIKAMNLARFISPMLMRDADSLKDANKKQVVAKYGLTYLREPLVMLFVCSGLYMSVSIAKMDSQIILILLVIFIRLTQTIGKLQSDYQTFVINEPFYRSFYSKERSFSKDIEPMPEVLIEQGQPLIQLKSISFSHGVNLILDDVTVSLPERGLITIEGESGVGKTTLVDLLLGFYRPTKGELLVNGILFTEKNYTSLRQYIGYLEQDTFIFHDSVANNISMGDPQISQEQISQALTKSNALSFVNQLESGLNANLGEGGSLLSGGQRQRIGIARALVRNPQVLIMDEFTSALDEETRDELLKIIKNLSETILIIAISHDSKVKQFADLRFSLDKGKLSQII